MATKSIEQSALSVERRTATILVSVGFVAWAVATLAFRLGGQYLLNPATEFVLLGVFVAVVPLMMVLMYALYWWQAVQGPNRRTAAILVALPGMLLDVVSTAFFETIFPNMDPAAAKYFGALLLLAYAVVLLTGFIPQNN
jgi:hypothetical protein